jgi:Rha family phage regulatory protein
LTQIIKDQFGVTEHKGIPVVGSRYVAKVFDKRHDNVLQSITDLKNQASGEFGLVNFAESSYKDSTGRKLPEYLLTRDGFTLLAMGFTGKRAMQFKIAYINRFNEMAEFIKSLSAAKLEFPEFTQAILMAHDEPKHYHFSNEINMINRIVLGMDAKGFKEVNGIDPKVSSIRPYLATHQIKAIEALQKFDIGLNATEPEYERRKQILTEYYGRLQSFKRLTA